MEDFDEKNAFLAEFWGGAKDQVHSHAPNCLYMGEGVFLGYLILR